MMSGWKMSREDFWEEEMFIDPDGFPVRIFPCPQCRALVLERHIRGHIDWHGQLRSTLAWKATI